MSTGLDLLRRLSPLSSSAAVAPAVARTASAPANAGQIDFAQMLTKAQAGELTSGMVVHTAVHSGVELNPMQLARLSVAADRAEAQGATRAIALIDGQAVHLDVPTRTVLGKADLSSGKTVTNIDAVIVVPEATTQGSVGVPAKDLTKLSPSLLSILKESSWEKNKDEGSPVG